MIRKLKVLGLAVVAVMAVSAVTAAASQAAGTFTWASGTTKLDATQDAASPLQVFKVNAGTTECNEVHGTANVTGTASTEVLSASVTYQNSGSADTCPGTFGTVTVNMNLCNYRFTAGETIGTSGMETTSAATHIVCPAGKKITVSAGGICTIEIGTQTISGGHTVYKTITGTPNDVTAEVTVEKIAYSQSGFFCPGGTGSFTNGTYKGNITITGTNSSGVQTSVEVH